MRHYYAAVDFNEKAAQCYSIFEEYKMPLLVAFCSDRYQAESLQSHFQSQGFQDVWTLSEDMNEGQIQLQLERYDIQSRSGPGSRAVMIATEAMARNLTIQQFCSVVVMDLPEIDENYIYEVGRNRIEGANGVSIVLATDLDGPRMISLAQFFKFEFEPLPEDSTLADIL